MESDVEIANDLIVRNSTSITNDLSIGNHIQVVGDVSMESNLEISNNLTVRNQVEAYRTFGSIQWQKLLCVELRMKFPRLHGSHQCHRG